MENAIDVASFKMAHSGRLTVGQKVKVVLFMPVLHNLTAIDKGWRLRFALWAMEEEAVLHNTWSFYGDS
jgi:hypothetical protein